MPEKQVRPVVYEFSPKTLEQFLETLERNQKDFMERVSSSTDSYHSSPSWLIERLDMSNQLRIWEKHLHRCTCLWVEGKDAPQAIEWRDGVLECRVRERKAPRIHVSGQGVVGEGYGLTGWVGSHLEGWIQPEVLPEPEVIGWLVAINTNPQDRSWQRDPALVEEARRLLRAYA